MRRLISLLALLALAGCGSGEEPSGGTIAYERGGGMTGSFVGLEIEADGTATLTTAAAGEERTRRIEVSDAELAEIRAHLDEADVGSLGENVTDDCFDCFSYTLTYGDEVATADSSTLSQEFVDATQPLADLTAGKVPTGFAAG